MASKTLVDELTVERFVTASRALVAMAVRSIESAAPEITVPQHRVLILLAAEGDLTVGEVADQLGVNQSNASRLIDRLQKLEMVVRERASEDGRVVRVRLTRRGRSIVEAVMRRRRSEVAEVLAQLTPEHAEAALAALEAFNEAAHERDERVWRGTAW